MTPKQVSLDKDSRTRRLTLIRERYEALILGLRQDGDIDMLDAFLDEDDLEPALE